MQTPAPFPTPSSAAYLEAALQRFARKCIFDAGTGCVLWAGALHYGQGKNVPYGDFWFVNKAVRAHRFAAKYIHGIQLTLEEQIDHCCDDFGILDKPETLCVQHLQPLPVETHRELTWVRRERGFGGEEDFKARFNTEPFSHVPFFNPPAWLVKYSPVKTAGLTIPALVVKE